MARWCGERGLAPGTVLSLAQTWRLARRWYHDRLAPDWRRPTPVEAASALREVGLTGEFWRLA